MSKLTENRTKYQKNYIAERKASFRKRAIEYKGGKCSKCGYNKCVDALEFHHINPFEKELKIGASYSCSWERIQKELDKCILLCANCHREEGTGL